MDFIDVTGASGTAYRFRRWSGEGGHPSIAGNDVLAVERDRKILAVGMLEDLSRASRQLVAPKGVALFTRLNIARQLREAEHLDIVTAHPEAERDAEPKLA